VVNRTNRRRLDAGHHLPGGRYDAAGVPVGADGQPVDHRSAARRLEAVIALSMTTPGAATPGVFLRSGAALTSCPRAGTASRPGCGTPPAARPPRPPAPGSRP